MDQLKNSTTVKVIDRFGYLVDAQEYRNTSFAELPPEDLRSFYNLISAHIFSHSIRFLALGTLSLV
jgi:hypothetical protein